MDVTKKRFMMGKCNIFTCGVVSILDSYFDNINHINFIPY